MNLSIVDPRTYSSWDEMLLRTPGASFFHSSAWAHVLSESYGYTPLYFTALENGKLRALVAVMEVDSILTGKRGVSLPFTDYCEPIVDGEIEFQDLLDHIIDYGKRRGWKYIEIRGGHSLLPRAPCLVTYFTHILDLRKGEEEIFSILRDSTRRNIKKSKSEGVKAKISSDPEAMKEFYRLNNMTRKRHGLPPQPYHFFEKVFEHIVSKGFGFITLASRNGEIIAGAVFFHFGDTAIFKYGASNKKFQALRANNLVMGEGIRWFCGNGFRSLSLGRTEPENKGLQQFKTGWGTDEKTLCYYRIDVKSMEFITNQAKVNSFTNKLFNGMPSPVLKLAGSLLYRHMG